MTYPHDMSTWAKARRALGRALLVAGCWAVTAGAPACKRDTASEDDGDADDKRSQRSKKRKRDAADDDRAERGPTDERKVLRELKTWIRDAQHAMFVEGDEDRYWRIYTDEGQVVTARAEHPHPYDFVVPAKRSRDFAKFRGRVPALEGYTQRYESETESLDGDKATLRWDVSTSWKQAEGVHRAVYGERYTLLRQKDTWRVSEKRTWTVSVTRPSRAHELAAYPSGVDVKYDEALWGELDAAVDRARLQGGTALFYALSDAGRVPEAYQLAQIATQNPLATAEAWYLLGMAASRLQFGEETKAAFAKAHALDARLSPPPPWGPKRPPSDAPSADGKKDDGGLAELMRRAATL